MVDMKAGYDMSGNVWAGMPVAATSAAPPPAKRRKVGVKSKAAEVATEDVAIAKLQTKLAKTTIKESGGGAGGSEGGFGWNPVAETVVAPVKKIVLKKKVPV